MPTPRAEHSPTGSGLPGDSPDARYPASYGSVSYGSSSYDDDSDDDYLDGEQAGPGSGDTFFAGIDDYTGPAEPDSRTFSRHQVTAILVAHNGARWLPKTLTALRRLSRAPQLVVAVDTGSTDATSLLLAKALGSSAIITMASDTGFGAAVQHVVEAVKNAPGLPSDPDDDGPPVEWLWLLHDDSAPDPDSLRMLLATVDASPAIGVAGPKVRGWSDPSHLVEVGLTIGGGGRRDTGLERHELDQGQHDSRSDVLAVGSAGLLVRRDVWDSLGGFDPRLPMFRDDVDLGWRANLAGHRVVVVPDAVVHHAEAAAHGLRDAHAAHGHVHRADRRSALHVVLANTPLYALPWKWLRLFASSLLRTVVLLAGKAPREALDEVIGACSVLFAPVPLLRARADRSRTRTVPASSLRHLLAPPMSGLRHGLESIAGLVSGRVELSPTGGSALDSGPTSDEADEMAVGSGRVRGLLERPGVQLGIGLVLVSLAGFRDLFWGSGFLQGGALLPSGTSAGDLWASYAAGWHDVGVGSATAAPAYLVPVAALATILLGKAWLAIDLLLILAAPLAGMVAYFLLGRLVSGQRLRALAAVTYALLPGVTGALAAGRLGTAVAAWLLPLAGALAAQAVGLGGWPGSLRRAWVAGLLLAVVVAFVPSVWLLALVCGAAGLGVFATRDRAAWLRLGAVLAIPLLALLPWTLQLLHSPSRILLEAGAQGPALASLHLPAWHLAVANPGGPGVPSAWVTVALLVAGLFALVRGDRQRLIVAAWLVTLTGLLVGLIMSAQTVTPVALGRPVHVWPGPASLLVGGGLVVAACVAADGSRARLRSYRFGWRQPLAAVLVLFAATAPLLLGLGWIYHGVAAPLSRDTADVLPAYVVASSAVPSRPRALVLKAHPDGVTTFALVSGEGRKMGDAEVAPSASRTRGLGQSVSVLLSGRGGVQQVVDLAADGVGYLVVDAPVDASLEARLDGVPGLLRVSSIDTGAVWRLISPGARVQLVRPGGAAVPIAADPGARTTKVDTDLPTVGQAGTMVLAEAADPGWEATADGAPLVGHLANGWAQAFEVPAGAHHVTVTYRSNRGKWLMAQALVIAVLVVLALPTRRRRGLDQEGDSDEDLPDEDAETAQLLADAASAPSGSVVVQPPHEVTP